MVARPPPEGIDDFFGVVRAIVADEMILSRRIDG